MLGSCFFSCSYSKRFSMAILPIGLQVPANRLDRRSASPQFQQPSSTSTASLGTSTASLGTSTSTTKSDAMNEQQAQRSVEPLRHVSFLGKEPDAAHDIDVAIAYLTISETANKWVHSGELARSRKLYCGLYPTRNVVSPTWTNLAT